LVIISGICSSC